MALFLTVAAVHLVIGAQADTTTSPSELFQRARAAFSQGDSATALTLMEKVVAAEPKNGDALGWLGFLFLRSGDAAKAVPILERALAIKPGSADIATNLANALHGLPTKTPTQQTRIQQLFEQAIKINPAATEAYTGLGLVAYRQGDYAKALVAFRRVTELKPADAAAHLNLGLAYAKRNQDADALVSCKRAITINPKLTAAWVTIAQLEFKAGKASQALAASAKATAIEPRNIDALLVHAQAAVASKRDDEAQVAYGAIADIYAAADAPASQRADASPRYNQGVMLVRLNRLADALAAFELAAQIDPKHADTAQNIGTVLYSLGRYPEALVKFQAAAEQDPKSAPKWRNVALAARKTADSSVEIGALRKAVGLDTTDVVSRQLLAPVLANSGRTAEAIALYRQLGTLQPKSAAPLVAMATLLMKQDQLDSALTALKDATGREPGNAVAWNNLGVLYERRGQINDAIASYKAALKANPSDADAKANLARFGKSTTGTTKP